MLRLLLGVTLGVIGGLFAADTIVSAVSSCAAAVDAAVAVTVVAP